MTKQVYPEIAESVEDKRLSQLVKLEELRLRNKELDQTMLIMHGKSVVLALQGHQDQIVKEEIITTEVINPQKNTSQKIITAENLKKYIKEKTGIDVKSMKQVVNLLISLGRDDLLMPESARLYKSLFDP